ncbi:MAG: glycosyl hydrolase family 18 protein [Lachnospiraceae bacterium]|nr:glycosyl hydrolase family 18 protein [Lachnospiraceae bacterium]
MSETIKKTNKKTTHKKTKKSSKKKKQHYERLLIVLILVAAVIGAIAFLLTSRLPSKKHEDLTAYFALQTGEDLPLVVNGIVCATGAREADGEVYISREETARSLNKRLYWDEWENLVCVTTPTVYQAMSMEELEASGALRYFDGIPYYALSFLKQWTDMEATMAENPRRLAVTTDFSGDLAEVAADTALRIKASDKSNILYDVTAGEMLRLWPDAEPQEGWTLVGTDDGFRGYVASDSLGATVPDDHTSVIGAYITHQLEERPNIAFYQTNNAINNASLQDKLNRGVSGINVLCPTWFFLDGPGQVTSIVSTEYVQIAHNNGYKVWALINDIDGAATSKDAVWEALRTTSGRRSIISKMMSEVLGAGVDGINVDLERISEEGVEAYLEFIRELSVECRNNGLTLSIDTYVPMDYSLYLDRREQGTVADYVIIMCYDEHYKGSETAGSVASYGFMENGIKRTLREVPADKIVTALPFYTRLWKTTGGGAPESKLMSMDEAQAYINENDMDVFWDEDVCQYVAEKRVGETLEQIWVEDADSLAAKMTLVNTYGVAGVAHWRLGDETPDVWPIISDALQMQPS